MTITLIKLLASSGILFAYYWLFLRNRKFHRYNRFYLLGAVLISMVLPFLKIDIFLSPTAPANKVILDTLEVITVNGGEEEVVLADAGTSWMDWFNSTNIMLSVYIIGAIVFLSLLIRSILYIRKIQHNYPVEKIEDLKFYNTAEPGTPFSFFRSIFWNNKVEFNSSEGQQIFRHELFHVRQKHSADLLFMEIVMLFAWFNPFFYLIKKELKVIFSGSSGNLNSVSIFFLLSLLNLPSVICGTNRLSGFIPKFNIILSIKLTNCSELFPFSISPAYITFGYRLLGKKSILSDSNSM